MAGYYTSAHVLKLRRKGRDVWQGVLRYQVPNPAYVEDPREPSQRKKAFGRRPNPAYVEDPREPGQRKKSLRKDVRKVFSADLVRTKTQAVEALAAWHAQMEREHAAPDASLRVDEYVRRYIDKQERLRSVTPSTVRDYRGLTRYLVRGEERAIAAVPLRDLTPARVAAWESALVESGLSGQTVLLAHKLLKLVCKHAFELGDLPVTPVRGFKAPKSTTGRPNALDARGRRTAMVALAGMGLKPLAVAAQLALYTGMRRGEICALTWANVDLDGTVWEDSKEPGPKIRVMQAFGTSEEGVYLKAPKTERGYRIIPLAGGMLEVLKGRRKLMWDSWRAYLDAIDMTPAPNAFSRLYVLGDEYGGYCRPDTLTHKWRDLSGSLGLVGTEGRPVTFHDLRHSFATSAVTRGVDLSSLSANIGHAQISTTLNMYTSHDTAAQRAASVAVANDLDNARAGTVVSFDQRLLG